MSSYRYSSSKTTWEGAILALLITAVLGPVIRGLVLVQLWGWFVATPFHVATLSVPVALGLSLLVNMLHPTQWKIDDADKNNLVARAVGWSVLLPLLALALGAIYHAFM